MDEIPVTFFEHPRKNYRSSALSYRSSGTQNFFCLWLYARYRPQVSVLALLYHLLNFMFSFFERPLFKICYSHAFPPPLT